MGNVQMYYSWHACIHFVFCLVASSSLSCLAFSTSWFVVHLFLISVEYVLLYIQSSMHERCLIDERQRGEHDLMIKLRSSPEGSIPIRGEEG